MLPWILSKLILWLLLVDFSKYLCMTFANISGLFLNFSTSQKKCKKSNNLRIHFFDFFSLASWFVTWGQKEGGIYLGIKIYDKGRTKFNIFSVFGEKIRSLISKKSKFYFWKSLQSKIAFLCHLVTPTATWQPNHTILTSSDKLILKAMTYTVWEPV